MYCVCNVLHPFDRRRVQSRKNLFDTFPRRSDPRVLPRSKSFRDDLAPRHENVLEQVEDIVDKPQPVAFKASSPQLPERAFYSLPSVRPSLMKQRSVPDLATGEDTPPKPAPRAVTESPPPLPKTPPPPKVRPTSLYDLGSSSFEDTVSVRSLDVLTPEDSTPVEHQNENPFIENSVPVNKQEDKQEYMQEDKQDSSMLEAEPRQILETPPKTEESQSNPNTPEDTERLAPEDLRKLTRNIVRSARSRKGGKIVPSDDN